ncbi:MAG: hypothetical protein Q8P18_09980 [Pseudomonadota bacterium]|nr:hypothetical protein [Pseudomonadota bacterium]
MMVEAWRNAAVLGAISGLWMALAQLRRAWGWLPAGVIAGVGAALFLGALAPSWALSSLVADAPWLGAIALAIWGAHAESAWLRVRAWPMVVLATALLGDRFVAVGLALAEPDPSRRARLVIAASGASLIGVTSGAAPLVLGWGGPEFVGMGFVLAAVGFVGGSGPIERARPDVGAAWKALVVPLLGAVVVWLAILSGALELVATALEQVPLLATPHGDLLVYAGAVVGGAFGDEGLLALCAQQIEFRALSVRGDTLPIAIRAGLAVGGGLPLLLLTGSRLRVGLPLWLLQLLLVTVWLLLR